MFGLFSSTSQSSQINVIETDPFEDINKRIAIENSKLNIQLLEIEQEEQRTIVMIRRLTKNKKNDTACRRLAKSIINSRRQKDRIHNVRSRFNHIVAQMKLANSAKSITEVIQSMSEIVNI
jgi:hypothetical protein